MKGELSGDSSGDQHDSHRQGEAVVPDRDNTCYSLLAFIAFSVPETAPTRLALPGLRSIIINYDRLIVVASFRYYLLAGTFCTTKTTAIADR